jgi:hypothetical protein
MARLRVAFSTTDSNPHAITLPDALASCLPEVCAPEGVRSAEELSAARQA